MAAAADAGATKRQVWVKKHSTKHKRPYWANSETGETTWKDCAKRVARAIADPEAPDQREKIEKTIIKDQNVIIQKKDEISMME